MTIMLMSSNSETLHFKLWLSEYTMFSIVTWNLGVYVLDWGYLNVNCWSNYFRECTLWVQGQQPGLYQFTRELDSISYLCSSCRPECLVWSLIYHVPAGPDYGIVCLTALVQNEGYIGVIICLRLYIQS